MEPEVRQGDRVVIDTALDAWDGSIVAAHGEFPEGTLALLKRFNRTGPRSFILTSDNPQYKPAHGRQIRILGVCLDIIRHLVDPRDRWR